MIHLFISSIACVLLHTVCLHFSKTDKLLKHAPPGLPDESEFTALIHSWMKTLRCEKQSE